MTEEELDTSKSKYIPTFQTVKAPLEDIQHIIETAIKEYEENKLQRFIVDTVNKKVHHSFKDSHDRSLAGTSIVLSQMVEQATAMEIYLGGAKEKFNYNIGKLAQSQDFTHLVMH